MADLVGYLITLALSAAPLSEVKGSIIFGLASKLSPIAVLSIAILGNIIMVPVAFWILRRTHFRDIIFRLFHASTSQKIEHHREKFEIYKELALFVIVSLPLPLLGAYTGVLISEILGWGWKKSMIAIACGIIVSGIIVFLSAEGIIKLISL